MNPLAHFAINTDDVEATRLLRGSFWLEVDLLRPAGVSPDRHRFEPVTLIGGLQKRRSLLPGVQTRGFECTLAVASLNATQALLRERNAAILLERSTLPQVGHLLFFEDPGGNLVGTTKFDGSAE